jgi:hypothetical protein
MNKQTQTIGDIITPEQYNQFLKRELKIPAQITGSNGTFNISPCDGGKEFFGYLQSNNLNLIFDLATDAFKAIQRYFNAWRMSTDYSLQGK